MCQPPCPQPPQAGDQNGMPRHQPGTEPQPPATDALATDAAPQPTGRYATVTWTSVTENTAAIPEQALVDAAQSNDDADYLTVAGTLNPSAFDGSVTGEFDDLLRGHEATADRVVMGRTWGENPVQFFPEIPVADQDTATQPLTGADVRPAARDASWIAESPDVADGDRYLVVFAASYDSTTSTVAITDPRTAAAAALDFVRDRGRNGTITWLVLDRRDRRLHRLEQREFDGLDIATVDSSSPDPVS